MQSWCFLWAMTCKDSDGWLGFGWMFPMIRKDVAVILVKVTAYLYHIAAFWSSQYDDTLFICFYMRMINLRWQCWILAIVIGHKIQEWDRCLWLTWMFPMIQRDVAVISVKFTPYFSHIAIYCRHNMALCYCSCVYTCIWLIRVDSVEYWHWKLVVTFRILNAGEDSDGCFP